MAFPNHHKLEDMAYLMALRKMLIHQTTFINDIITLKESSKELSMNELPQNPDFSFSSPTNQGTDQNMHDLHQAIRLYDDNNKKILMSFMDAILKRYDHPEDKEKAREKLMKQVKIKRSESRAASALNLVQGFNPLAKENAEHLMEGVLHYLYPQDDTAKPDPKYWFNYETPYSVR